jgi:hypothetical protein
MAAHGEDASRMRGIARREATRILHENMPWGNPFARLVHATAACQEGDQHAALDGLTEAMNAFDATDMHLYAAICRYRLGAVLGAGGDGLRVSAEPWMAAQEIRNPRAMMRLIAPGLPG